MKMQRITERQNAGGRYLAFVPTSAMRDAMATQTPNDREPSFMQAAHLDLREATAETGEQDDIWLGFTYRIPGTFDADAMAHALTRWVQRHGVMHGWFVKDPERPTGWARYDLPNDAIAFEVVDLGELAAEEVAERVSDDFRQGCNPLGSIGYAFRALVAEEDAILFMGLDHSYSDGTSFFTVYHEMDALYREETGGAAADLPPVGDFIDFAQAERARVADADITHPAIASWAEFWMAGDQELGRFPLSLGTTPGVGVEIEPSSTDILTGEECAQLDEVAARHGMNTASLIFGAVAHTAREFGGADSYRFVNPVHTRSGPEWLFAAGWFINVIPIHVPLEDKDEDVFAVAERVRAIFRTARPVAELPAMKVYQLVEEALGIKLSQVGEGQMLSYMDLRIIPGQDRWDEADIALVSRAGKDSNANSWLFREARGLHSKSLIPMTPEAQKNVPAFFEAVGRTLRDVIAHG
jgi:hypothetical protein